MNIKSINNNNKKAFYFFIGCILLSVIIIGATFAYFTASTSDSNTVSGGTYLTNFRLSVERVTTVDMAYGLVPMKDSESPHAAEQKCLDDFDNAGCQIYKITVGTDSVDPVFKLCLEQAFVVKGPKLPSTSKPQFHCSFSFLCSSITNSFLLGSFK